MLGEYRAIMNLCRVLPDGLPCKLAVDEAVDRCNDVGVRPCPPPPSSPPFPAAPRPAPHQTPDHEMLCVTTLHGAHSPPCPP